MANRIAPEHLELCVDNPFDYLGEIQNAGSVFLGRYNPEPMGDYFAGPNHVLPTNGTANFSPRWRGRFYQKIQHHILFKGGPGAIHKDIIAFAESERLTAHANSIRVRFEEEKQ